MLLLFFVNVLAEIHDSANRGMRIWRHFHEVETNLGGELERFFSRQNPELLAFRADHANFWNFNTVIATNVRKRVVVAALELAGAVAAAG
jgi:hypothetical protein